MSNDNTIKVYLHPALDYHVQVEAARRKISTDQVIRELIDKGVLKEYNNVVTL